MDMLWFKGVSPWLSIPLVFLVWVLLLLMLKRAAFALARRLSSQTKTDLDDLLFNALDFPLQLVVYASGVLVVQSLLPQSNVELLKYPSIAFKIVAIVAVILFVEKFVVGLVRHVAPHVEILRTGGAFAQGLLRAVVFVLGGLIILDSMGVSITPIIASLGIGSLAVALALQPTLENFFAGIQLVIDKPVQVGQFVRLESGEEGAVTQVGWRSTWICMPNNNTVVLPNKLLVNSRVMNFFYPDTEMAVPVGVGVSYDSDLEKVERVSIEVGREVMTKSEGGVPSFEPVVRYHTFSDFSINFNVVLRARDFAGSALVKHEFIKLLQKRYAQEGITIPYPTRTVINEKQ